VIRLRDRLHLDALRRDDQGMALAAALIFGMVILVMVATALTVATGGLRRADTEQDWNGALAAAYAGVEEYQARLSNDASYARYGNPGAPFSVSSPDLVLPGGATENRAFGTGRTGTWATVPGSGGTAQFRYEVDSSKLATLGTLRLRATGKVGQETRSVTADIRRQGFTDYLYFTEYEIADPQHTGVPASCRVHAWEKRPTSNCGDLAFGSNDVIDGDAHSNDTMRICAAWFKKTVTTATPLSSPSTYTARDSNYSSCSGQKFRTGTTAPERTSTIGLPDTNTKLIRQTRNDLKDEVPNPGCLYTGPTDIVLNGDGTMTVKSPLTRWTQTAEDQTKNTKPEALCGKVGPGDDGLGSVDGATFDVPTGRVVYVQDVPASSSDRNYSSPLSVPATCTKNGVGYPLAGETVPGTGTALLESVTGTGPCAYGSRSGDVFVRGTLSGQLTIAPANYLYVTGDLVYGDPDTDVLGLAPTNTAWVWNPVKGSTAMLPGRDREIDAAIISAGHSFTVQNFDTGGARGTLTLKGALGQRYRGVVSYGSNGYIKNYVYDSRFKYLSPPQYLNPVTTVYGITTMSEVKAGYESDGRAS
jgi:hypothetical protein